MSWFHSEHLLPVTVTDLAPVVQDIRDTFERDHYHVDSAPGIDGGFDISITHGGMFKAVLGMKTALRVHLETEAGGTRIRTGVGIFGQQAVPFAIAMLVFWPVLATEVWGLIQQSRLDTRVVQVAVESLTVHADGATTPPVPRFCTACGHELGPNDAFCAACGTALSSTAAGGQPVPVADQPPA